MLSPEQLQSLHPDVPAPGVANNTAEAGKAWHDYQQQLQWNSEAPIPPPISIFDTYVVGFFTALIAGLLWAIFWSIIYRSILYIIFGSKK